MRSAAPPVQKFHWGDHHKPGRTSTPPLSRDGSQGRLCNDESVSVTVTCEAKAVSQQAYGYR